jgi:hypothetical protein
MPALPEPEPPDPTPNPLPAIICRAMVRDLSRGLPDPPDDTPDARAERDHAAIAEAAWLAPADPAELRIALRCVTADAWANAWLRLMNAHAADTPTLLRLSAQAAAMARLANASRALLQRLQAQRRPRTPAATHDAATPGAATPGAATPDAATPDADTQAMQRAQDGLMQAWHDLARHLAHPLPKAPPAPIRTAPVRTAPTRRSAEDAEWDRIVAERRQDYDAAIAAGRPEPDWMTPAWRLTLGLPEPPPPTEEEKRRLHWLNEADRYAIIHPLRSRLIRRLGDLPPDCGVEPPEPELLDAIRTGQECNQQWADNLSLEQAKLNAGRDRDLLWRYEEALAQAGAAG